MIILTVFVIILSIFWVSGIVYLLTGHPRKLFHDAMHWHRPRDDEGMNCECYHCKYCGIEITCDSQGNWYHIGQGD